MIETGRARSLLTREGMICDGIVARVIQVVRGPVRQYAPSATACSQGPVSLPYAVPGVWMTRSLRPSQRRPAYL